MPSDSLEGFAYEAALRALDKQEDVLNEVRSRTGALLAASALAASFLGREAFADPQPLLAGLALVAFVVTVAASVFILLPRRDQFIFALSAPDLYTGLYAVKDQPDEIRRRLAYDLQRLWNGNDDRLQPLFTAYRVGAGALVVEILALVALVSDSL